MKKLKKYLDTSVISHLDQHDAPEKMADTLMLWELIKAGKYGVCIFPVVIGEVMDCTEPKRSSLLGYLGIMRYKELQETEEVTTLASKYLEAGILNQKSLDDCRHIAYACVYDCDMLVSWNFKHLVNVRTITGVKGVNALMGYREMPIYTPTMLVSGGADSDT